MTLISDIITRIRNVRQEIINSRETEVLKISNDLLALIKLRIQTSGKDYTGAQFAPYVPGYAKERKSKGYQINIVDFTRTGRFWNNVQPVLTASSVTSATVRLEGSEQRSKDIVKGAEKKRGNILQPSKQEVELARKANQSRIERYLLKIKVQ